MPLITPQTVSWGIKIWKFFAPFHKLKLRRLRKKNKKLIEQGLEPLPLPGEELEVVMVKEILGSILRTFGPALTAYLAGQGISVEGADATTVIVVAIAVFVAMQAWSIYRKVMNKPRAV